MPARPSIAGVWVSVALAGLVHAHAAVFHPAMYCFNGTNPSVVDPNNNAPVHPLYQMKYSEFWIHAFDGCDNFPPEAGKFLEIPAGGSFTVEIATNRACTSLNPNSHPTEWGDCNEHPELENIDPHSTKCIVSPNLHAQNQSMAAGTAFGIAYESDISKVTPENVVIFSVAYNTPWKRLTTYKVPSGMPECPEGGCTVVWGWVANGCGEPNMFLMPYKAKVIPDSTSPKKLGVPKPAVWCEDDESKCVKGPKQMLVWHQAEANNIQVVGYDLSGQPKSPGYNAKCGFKDGAQDDIFVESTGSAQSVESPTCNAPVHSRRMETRRARGGIF